MIKQLILWLVKRSSIHQRVVNFDDKFLFFRFCPFWYDEWIHENGKHFWRPPWYRPFNILLHLWRSDCLEDFHDHPRWSITICLKGKIIEMTPWEEKILTPGSIVFRSRKAIHAFKLPPEYKGKTWTLFIVGRRNHKQNTYQITRE